MNDIDSKEINQALPVRHPGTIEPSGQIVIVAALEVPGAILHHIWHWPWWIGAQLPVAYLLWKWSRERQFAHRLASAWNKKRDAEVELSRQLREAQRRGDGTD